MEALICLIGLFITCGLGGISILISLLVALFKVKDEQESTGEISLKQQKKIE